MIVTLGQAVAPQTAILISIFKPLVFLALLIGWAWVASWLDKDMAKNHLPRPYWNSGQFAAGALAFALLLLIPWFIVGVLLAILIVAGPFVGYCFWRNTQVDPFERWSSPVDLWRKKAEDQRVQGAQTRADFKFLGPDGKEKQVPVGDDPLVTAHNTLSQLVTFAIPRDGESIDIAVTPQKATVTVLIDGVVYPQAELDPRMAMGIVDYVKQHANLDVQDRRRQQTGKLTVETLQFGKHTLGVATSGSTRGLSLSIKIDPSRRTLIKFDDLGLLDAQKQQLEAVLDQPGKVFLVACPQGQGMTTTQYSLIERHDPYTENIVTLEDAVASELEGITHNQIEPGLDADGLSQRLTAILRRDPQVVLISKITDSQLAQVVVGSAHEVRFYAGLFMADTFQALRAWAKAIGDLPTAAESLGGIVSVRLLRKLCQTCRVPYTPDPKALRKMNLPAGQVTTLYRQSGQVLVKGQPAPCPSCGGLGYRGRTGVFEVMPLDDQARQLVAQGQVDQLRGYLRKQRMLYLQEAALARVVEGVTSIGEVTRVFRETGAAGGE